MPNAITYIKNVGKSVGYASFDIAKKTIPVFNEFAETNGELASDMYKSVRNLKKKVKDAPNKVMNSKYGQFGTTLIDNLKSDLKSGKLYNKERIDQSISSFGGEDFDFGFDDDIDDFGISSSSDDLDFEDNGPSTNEMLDIVGEKASNAISNTMARSAEYIVQSNTEANKAMYNQMNAIYGGIHTGMSVINQNLSKIIEFTNESTITHYENSRTFYTEVTRMDQERNQYLKEILENVKSINEPPKKTSTSSSGSKYSDLVSFDGTLNISEYYQSLKKKVKNNSYVGLLDMLFDKDMGMSDAFTASPLSGILTVLLSSLIPQTVNKSSKKLNDSLSGLTGNMMMKLKEKGNEFGILASIANFFGIDTGAKTKLDPSKYEKGKIPFDGVTKKAIVEVIPTYLSKILSAINKQPESRFNYDTGKFVTVDRLRKEFESLKTDSANRAAYEIDSVIRTKKKSLSFRSKEEEQQFDEDWEAIKQYLYSKQKTFNTRDKSLGAKTFGLKGGAASDINVRIFQELLDGTSENIRYAHQLFREIDDQNRRMTELENSSSYNALFDGSIDVQTSSSSDKGAAQQSRSNKKGRGGKRQDRKDKAYDKAQEKIRSAASNIDEIDRESEVARIMGKAKEESPTEKATKSFSQRMHEASGLSAKMAVLAQSATELAKKPARFITAVMDKADERLYDLIYGPKDDKHGRKSFVGRMFGGLEKMFNRFAEFMDEHIIEPFKKVFTKENMHNATQKMFNAFGIDIDKLVKDVRVKLFGEKDTDGKRTKDGIFSKFMDDFKAGFKDVFGWVKGAFKSAGDWFGTTSKKNKAGQTKEQRNQARSNEANLFRQLVSDTASNITEAATGLKRVDKTGLAVISEGEMIVPPDLNPFNIAKRKRDERKVKDKLKSGIDSIFEYGGGTTDGTSGEPMTEEELNLWEKMAAKNPKLIYEFINKKTGGKSKKEKQKFLKDLAAKSGKALNYAADYVESTKESFEKDDYEEGRNPFHQRMFEEVAKFVKSIGNTTKTFGMSDEDVESFKEKATSFIGNIKEYGGTMAAGATIGAGLSVVTGLIGGPLVGAAVGASVALIKKSKTVQDMLFGNEEEGKKGLLPKNITDGIKKYLPDVGKGATVGGILAALPFVPGGPVAGIIVGSALGFAKNNQAFQDAVFGEGTIGEENKEKFQKKIQTLLPKMGAGALAGLVAGPFGSVTANLILGSALGFATDTNLFKDLLFGKENAEGVREGGILKSISDPATEFFKKTFGEFKEFMDKEMVGPIRNAIEPIANEFKLIGKSITDNLGEMFKEKIGRPIERAIKDFVVNPLGKFFGSLIKTALKPAKFILSAPSKIIGHIGDGLRRKRIRSGQANYMSAAQRNAFRKSKGELYMGGSDDYQALDASLENMSYEDLDVAKNSLNAILDTRKDTAKASHESFERVRKEMYSFDKSKVKPHITRAALDMVRSGHYEQAIKFVREADIEENTKTTIIAKLTKESARMKIAKATREDSQRSIPEIVRNLNNLGINIDEEMLNKIKKDPKELKKLIDTLDNEQKYKKKNDPISELNDDEQKRHNEAMDLLKQILAELKGEEVGSDSFKEKVKAQEDRYNWVAGLSDKAEDETAAEEEQDSLKGKIRGNASNTRSFVSNLISGFKNDMKASFSEIKANAGEVVDSIKGSKRYKKYFGDGSTDYLKHTTAILAAQAAKDGIDVSNIDTSKDPNSLLKTIKSKFKNSKIVQFLNGRPVVYTTDKDGNPIVDTSNAENRETFDEDKERQETQKGILNSLKSIPTSLGDLFKNLFGNKEKDKDKKSFLEKIWDFFRGDDGKLSFTSILSTVLKSAIPAALLGLGLTGKLDNIANKLSGGAFGSKGSNNSITAKDGNGNNVEIMLNENGEPVTDADGNYVSVSGQVVSGDSYLNTTSAVATMSLSDRLKYNFVRGTVRGTGSIVGSTVKNNKLVKGITSAAKSSKVSTIIKAATDAGAMDDVINGLLDNTDTFIKALKKVPFLKKYVNDDMIINLSVGLGDLIEKNLPKAGSALTKLGKSISKLALPIAIAMAIADFSTGWQDASTILKIKAENVTTPQKIVCGLIRTLKNLIPVIGTFIPDQVITDFFIDHVAKWFGIDVSEITKQRDEAQAELDEYNAEHGTSYSWADYNKKVLGNYTWTEKIGNGVSSFVTNIKEKGFKGTMSSIGDSIKTSKVGQAVGNAGKWISEKASQAGNWIGEKATNIASGAKKVGGQIWDSLSGGAFNDQKIRETFGLSEDQEITMQDRVSVFLNSRLSPVFGKDVTKEIDGTITRIKTGMKSAVDGLNQKVGSLFGMTDDQGNPVSFTEGVKSCVKNAVESLSKGWANLKDNVKTGWENLKTDAKENFDKFVKNSKAGLDIVNKKIGSSLGFEDEDGNPLSLTDGVKYKVNEAIQNLKTGWSNLKDNVKTGWENLSTNVKDKFKTFKENVVKGLGIVNDKLGAALGMVDDDGNVLSLTDGVKHNWNTFKEGLADKWKNITDGISGVWNKVTDYFKDSAKVSEETHANRSSAKGSGLYGRGSNTFISQIDPRYRGKKFNISGDTQVQTLGDTGCAPAAAAMAVNSTLSSQPLTMEEASRNALKYKVKNDGVNASYFKDEFARHGIYANYISNSDSTARSQEIMRQLVNNNKVVLMGQDSSNISKSTSPFGPNPHYVVANGISEDGKYIYIDDPESRTPNIKYRADKILGSSKLGISASVAKGTKFAMSKMKKFIGRGSYGANTIQYKVWNALRSAGYNEIATAAAMGNIQHESGFNPSAIEKSTGKGFGLVQWTEGRRRAIEKYAREKGADVNSLDLQIEYLLMELAANSGIWTGANSKYGFGSMSRNDWANGTDLVRATKAFMCCFERPSYDPSVNHIDRRIVSANEYLQAFTGTSIDTNVLNSELSNISAVASTQTVSTSSSSSGGILAEIINAFSGLASAYGLSTPSTSSTDSSTSEFFTTEMSGTANGNVSANASKAELQKALVNTMYSVQGKLKYAQNNTKYPGSRNPDDINPDGTRSGDCSSTVRWAYQKVLGIDPGSWTGDQRTNSNTYTVATNTRDESKLQLGDLLLKDGHVEMYAGNNTMIGHGGGNDGKKFGPTVKTLDKSGKYDLVRRWVGFKGDSNTANNTGGKPGASMVALASGSGLDHPTNTAYDNALRHIKSDELTSILPFGIDENELGDNKTSVMQFNNNKLSGSMTSKPVSKSPTYVGRAAQVQAKPVTANSNSMTELVKSILKLLVQLVTNTDQLNHIAKLLGEYISAVGSTDTSQKAKETAVIAKNNLITAMQNSGSSKEPNAELMRLIEATERIARE